MELPPYRPPSTTPNNSTPLGQTPPASQPSQSTPQAPPQSATPAQRINANNNNNSLKNNNNSLKNNNFLKNNIAQQFNASVVKSQAIATSVNTHQISYQITLSINSPSGNHILETTTNIALAEGQQLKVEIVSPERIRIVDVEKAGLAQLLNQHLKSALATQEPLGQTLKSLQQIQQQLQQLLQQPLQKQQGAQLTSTEASLSADKKHIQTLQQAMQKILTQIPTVKHLSSEGKLKQSIQNSGVVLEAKIKAQINSTLNPLNNKTDPSTTLKSTLKQLKQTFQQNLQQNLRQNSAQGLQHRSSTTPQENSKKSTSASSNLLNADLKVQLQRLQQTLQALQLRQSTPGSDSTQKYQADSNSSNREAAQNTQPTKNQQNPSALEKKTTTNAALNRQPNVDLIRKATHTSIASSSPQPEPKASALSKPTSETAPISSPIPYPKKSPAFTSSTHKTMLPLTSPPDHSHFFLNHTPVNRNALPLQSPVTNTLDEAIENLLKQSRNGLARIQLNQLQSLFNLTQATLNDPATTQTLQTELPLTWKDSHIEIVQLTIEDKAAQNAQEKDQQRQWQINLRFDFEEMGIIHIQLTLNQTDANTIIWVEQTNSLPAFKKHLERLNQSLQKLGLSVNDIQCRPGLPIIKQTRLDTHLVDINT